LLNEAVSCPLPPFTEMVTKVGNADIKAKVFLKNSHIVTPKALIAKGMVLVISS
jgi:hypothetical protein